MVRRLWRPGRCSAFSKQVNIQPIFSIYSLAVANLNDGESNTARECLNYRCKARKNLKIKFKALKLL